MAYFASDNVISARNAIRVWYTFFNAKGQLRSARCEAGKLAEEPAAETKNSLPRATAGLFQREPKLKPTAKANFSQNNLPKEVFPLPDRKGNEPHRTYVASRRPSAKRATASAICSRQSMKLSARRATGRAMMSFRMRKKWSPCRSLSFLCSVLRVLPSSIKICPSA